MIICVKMLCVTVFYNIDARQLRVLGELNNGYMPEESHAAQRLNCLDVCVCNHLYLAQC